MNKSKGVVSTGDSQTTHAAEIILQNGGNAYDAILGALFTACLSEPVLASIGGGGFLLAKTKDNQKMLFDFFVQTPIEKHKNNSGFFKVTADFGGQATQDFFIGLGSVATPGIVKGIFEIHKKLCKMPLAQITEPAIELAKKGVKISPLQSYILEVVSEIYNYDPVTQKIYSSPSNPDKLLAPNESYALPEYADFLQALVKNGPDLFYKGEVAQKILSAVKAKGGYLTQTDFDEYKCVIRRPLEVEYNNNLFLTNPPPSSGGILIAFVLKILEKLNYSEVIDQNFKHEMLVNAIKATDKFRQTENLHHKLYSEEHESLLDQNLISKYAPQMPKNANRLGSTTHMSVIDSQKNIASMTVTNGEGCSYIVPGTGIMLNNMLGEEDLNPNGFGNWQTNQRMSSMMAPSILFTKDGQEIALGSGGSSRIKSAITQVILNIDSRKLLQEAVESPRLHHDSALLNIEEGFSSKEVDYLNAKFPENKKWQGKNMFFGGVHACLYDKKTNNFEGAGDSRRGGSSVIVN